MTEPRAGPPTTAMAYPTIASPRFSTGQMSPKTPPVLVTGAGALPKKPAKNRGINIVCISFAVAVPNEKIAAMEYGMRTATDLPYISERGAQSRGSSGHSNVTMISALVSVVESRC